MKTRSDGIIRSVNETMAQGSIGEDEEAAMERELKKYGFKKDSAHTVPGQDYAFSCPVESNPKATEYFTCMPFGDWYSCAFSIRGKSISNEQVDKSGRNKIKTIQQVIEYIHEIPKFRKSPYYEKAVQRAQ